MLYALSVLFVWQICVLPHANASDAQGVRYGKFEVTYTPAQLIGQSTLDSVSDVIGAKEEITWKMYVPETYNASKPAGLMVYIGPTAEGRMPPGWQLVVDEENLIWISANQSGEETQSARRILYAVLAPQIASRGYLIDTDRIYLSGFSDGGEVASTVAINFANLFDGAIYICGAMHWTEHPPKLFEHVKANRYVFLTGEDDINRDLTGFIYRKYQDAGVPNVRLMIVRSMRHTNPDTENFRKALNYLDERE
jgi:predicted peptidase